jgi:hypothetical protein
MKGKDGRYEKCKAMMNSQIKDQREDHATVYIRASNNWFSKCCASWHPINHKACPNIEIGCIMHQIEL